MSGSVSNPMTDNKLITVTDAIEIPQTETKKLGENNVRIQHIYAV